MKHRIAPVLITALSLLMAWGGTAAAEQIRVNADLDHGLLEADKKQTTFLRVSLKGFELESPADRGTVNVAIVIDKSGSMSGKKIDFAKRAARAALGKLSPKDIVSVLAYDGTVQVLVPATKVSDRRTVLRGIDRLSAGGMTALFAGTSKGAAEVRKFLRKDTINRVILLSDGQANIGPSSPGELGRLGKQLGRQGIAVTTLGLGLDYNEDTMAQLATKSGGSHFFVERPQQLTALFDEGFGRLTTIVANELTTTIELAPGFRPVRVLGRDADIIGQTVTVNLARLYAGAVDEILLEVEARPHSATAEVAVGSVAVSYHNVVSKTSERLKSTVGVGFTTDIGAVHRSVRKEVSAAVVGRLAQARSQLAIQLRDKGQQQQAAKLLKENASYLSKNSRDLDSETLAKLAEENLDDAKNLDNGQWNRKRKQMRSRNQRSPAYDFADF
ncbi:MAG: Ca-activated chloride channel family protein [Myxococcota bacterium]|jgi:Ca-activated chloride channel family protein